MSFSKTIYFCLTCNASAFTKEKLLHCECSDPQYVVKANVIFEMPRTKWQRFLDRLLDMDINWGLAFLGSIGINYMITSHFPLTAGQSIFEGFCFGFMMMRVLK